MARTIRVSQAQADDLAAVCAIGADALGRVATTISGAEPTIKRERIRELFKQVLSDAEGDTLSKVIFGLSAVESHKANLVNETIDGLTAALRTKYIEKDERFSDWERVSAALLCILRCKSVYFAAKAVDISYDFERILSDCRIITSIRPIYTDERDEIVGNAVVQTLRLDYVDGDGHSDSISIAIDLSDVARLGEISRDALQKANVVKQKLADWRMETLMAGDNRS